MFHRQCATVVLSLACLVTVSACGSSSPPSGAASSSGPASQGPSTAPESVSGSTHEFSATLGVTGAVQQTASFTQNLGGRPACPAFAQAGIAGIGPSAWYLPDNPDATFLMTWDLLTYKGPGTYTDPAAMSASLSAGGQVFDQWPTSVLSVTVKADGSGWASFQNLHPYPQASTAMVSGTETWTCS